MVCHVLCLSFVYCFFMHHMLTFSFILSKLLVSPVLWFTTWLTVCVCCSLSSCCCVTGCWPPAQSCGRCLIRPARVTSQPARWSWLHSSRISAASESSCRSTRLLSPRYSCVLSKRFVWGMTHVCSVHLWYMYLNDFAWFSWSWAAMEATVSLYRIECVLLCVEAENKVTLLQLWHAPALLTAVCFVFSDQSKQLSFGIGQCHEGCGQNI